MSDTSIAQRLFVKPNYQFLVVNAPRGYKAQIGELPKDAKIVMTATAPVDIIQVFVANRKELESQLPKLKKLLAPQATIWVTYYKGTSKIKTDINRDTINAYAHSIGLQGVAMISINDDWAALRLKLRT